MERRSTQDNNHFPIIPTYRFLLVRAHAQAPMPLTDNARRWRQLVNPAPAISYDKSFHPECSQIIKWTAMIERVSLLIPDYVFEVAI